MATVIGSLQAAGLPHMSCFAASFRLLFSGKFFGGSKREHVLVQVAFNRPSVPARYACSDDWPSRVTLG